MCCAVLILFVCCFLIVFNDLLAARYGHRSVVLSSGTVLVMGGRDDYSFHNDVWKSVDAGASWSVVKSNADWAGN